MRRLLFLPATCLLLVVFMLYMRRDQLGRLSPSKLGQGYQHGVVKPTPAPGILPVANKTAYVNAIMDPDASDLPRLHCPKLNASRYQYLQAASKEKAEDDDPEQAPTIRYFFALDLRQCLPLLPRLLGSVVEVIRFLGPKHCALSIVEGNSDDGTDEVLAALAPALDSLGITYHLRNTPINPKTGDRIAALAQLRNLALQPIFDSQNKQYTPTTKILFLNDVSACAEDLLELLHQHTHLHADMVCAMDWTYVGPDPTFYDVWIARGMTGDSFFSIPPDGSWDSAWNLFWNDDVARGRFAARRPFQVFSCWNGGVVFAAGPLLLPPSPGGEGGGGEGVKFRRAREGECEQGEPELFCKDLWWRGFGKIAVVPVVNLEYSDEGGRKIKEAKGYVSKWVGADGWTDEVIDWRAEPPAEVKCMAVYADQFFEPWNKTQPGT